jgi:hypothetical protein
LLLLLAVVGTVTDGDVGTTGGVASVDIAFDGFVGMIIFKDV